MSLAKVTGWPPLTSAAPSQAGTAKNMRGYKLFSRCGHLKVCSLAEISRPFSWPRHPNALWQAIMSHLIGGNKGWRDLGIGLRLN